MREAPQLAVRRRRSAVAAALLRRRGAAPPHSVGRRRSPCAIRQHQVRRRVLVAAARAERGLQLALRRVVASAPRRRRSQHHCTRAAPSRAPACLPPPPLLDAVEAGSSSLSQPATRLTVPSGRSLGDSYASARRRRRVAIASAATFRAAQNSGASELAVRRRSQHRPPPASRACPTALEQRFVHENPPCDPHRARQKKRASKASALLGLAGGPPTVLATASGGSPARRPHAPRALAPQGLSRGLSCGAIVRGYRIVAPSFGPRLRTAPPPPLACVALRCLPPLPCPPRLRRPCGLRLPPPVASRRDALSWSSPPISPDLALSSPELPLSSPHPATRVS